VTLRVYEGIPLTQIGREVGTSVRMIDVHYAGVIANWDESGCRPSGQSKPLARMADGKWTERLMTTEARTTINSL
jgi:hypothetical protein